MRYSHTHLHSAYTFILIDIFILIYVNIYKYKWTDRLKLRSVTFLSYGELWKLHRRLLTQQLNPRAIDIYQPWQVQSTVELLKELLEAKDDFWTCSKKCVDSFFIIISSFLFFFFFKKNWFGVMLELYEGFGPELIAIFHFFFT